jgi:hypothetical protein
VVSGDLTGPYRAHVEDIGAEMERRLVAVPQRGAVADPEPSVGPCIAERPVTVERQMTDPDLVVGVEHGEPGGDVVGVLVVGAGHGRVDAEPDDVEARGPGRPGKGAEVLPNGAVTLHRRGQLQQHPSRPSVERLDVGDRTDREDRSGVGRRLERRSEHDRHQAAGQPGQFVNRPDGDDGGELGGDLGERGPSEAVSVALDDGHESGAAPNHPVDMGPPRARVDGEAQRHVSRRYRPPATSSGRATT